MGYGLHFGWAIEGAIGSMHKVDKHFYIFHCVFWHFYIFHCVFWHYFQLNISGFHGDIQLQFQHLKTSFDQIFYFQIDASYLSPHVNMASRLEAATKQYGVEILLSEDVFGLMTQKIQDLCRLKATERKG